ncbi:hypothetical protein FRB91_002918 [Serendipita sp. 411]|nr:hypothetical protein FRB91_002918 [Serendipita sp. 411]
MGTKQEPAKVQQTPRGRLMLTKTSLISALIVAIVALGYGYSYYSKLGTAFITSPLSFYSNPWSPSTNPAKRAYATTLYDEGYVPGALLLGHSLQKHRMFHHEIAQNMVLLHIPGRVSNWSLKLLEEVGWTTLPVESIPPPPQRLPADNFMDQYTKLRLFELEQFEQIFYMDADMLVIKPFPEIWSFPVPLAATRDVRMGYGWLPTINAGSLLLKPNVRLLNHMLEIAPKFRYNTVFAEQGLLQAYWSRDMTMLPYIYNAQLGIKRVFPKIWEEFKKDMKVLHFTGVKPWDGKHQTDMPVERDLWRHEWRQMIAQRRREGYKNVDAIERMMTEGWGDDEKL